MLKLTVHENAAICVRCDQFECPQNAKCLCKKGGSAHTGECPDMLFPSRGIGDTIAKVTHALGIQPCAPCKKRQAELNAVLPYK